MPARSGEIGCLLSSESLRARVARATGLEVEVETVGNMAYLMCAQLQWCTGGVKNDKVIAQTMHLGERQLHGNTDSPANSDSTVSRWRITWACSPSTMISATRGREL